MPKSIHRPEYQVLRELVREERTQAGITQTDLSNQLGRSQSFVSDVERGVRRLDVLELRDVCLVLGRDFLDVAAELEARIRKGSVGRGRTESPGRRRRSPK